MELYVLLQIYKDGNVKIMVMHTSREFLEYEKVRLKEINLKFNFSFDYLIKKINFSDCD